VQAQSLPAASSLLLRSPGALVALLLVTSVLGMLGFSSFSALLPEFERDWGLTNAEAGWISTIFYGGYVAAVPFLVGSTDRVDPRRVYLWSFVIAAAASLGFALLAQGFWSAMLLRALAGVGLAGGYMPGLKLLTDHATGPRQSRYIALYTGGFSLGTATSFAFTGEFAAWFGWRAAFAVAALAAFAALALVLALVPPTRAEETAREGGERGVLDFRPVFRNRAAMAFILGYAGHLWELFALRSWLVAYLVAVASFSHENAGIAAASWLSTAIVLLSTVASIYGAELATRSDRRRVISRIMALSVATAALTGFSVGLPLYGVAALCLLYHMVIMADSAALTGGAVATALPGQRGATLAVHSILGFSGAFVGPLAVGTVLDLSGGAASRLAWGLAFLAMGAGSAAGIAAIRRLS
jgi:predicted MFS family arabinose efflux permease